MDQNSEKVGDLNSGVYRPPLDNLSPTHIDAFGNKVLSVKDFGLGKTDKAELLITETGIDLLNSNPTLLVDIDRGLIGIESIDGYRESVTPGGRKFRVPNLTPRESFILGENITLRRLRGGRQSRVYLFEMDDKKFIVKEHASQNLLLGKNIQPYTDEMKQIQMMKHDLGKELADIGIDLPTFLFATERVALIKFEEGSQPTRQDMGDKILRLQKVLEDYILRQQAESNPLWKNIHLDLIHDLTTQPYIRLDNFIKRLNGEIVFIDPFYKKINELSVWL